MNSDAVSSLVLHILVILSDISTEHVQEYMSSGAEVAEKLTNSYITLNSMLGKPSETQTTKDPKDPKKVPMTTLKPTFLCLNCGVVASAEDRDTHSKTKKHMWCE